MPAKKEPTISNVNTNNNTNNVHVNIKQPRRAPAKKKPEPNWYSKAIIGGIITLIVSIIFFYVQQNMNSDTKKDKSVESNTTPVEPIK